MLYDYANEYIINCNNRNEGNSEIYEFCWLYLLDTATNNEIKILKNYFKIINNEKNKRKIQK
jgi:hypothetical protein